MLEMLKLLDASALRNIGQALENIQEDTTSGVAYARLKITIRNCFERAAEYRVIPEVTNPQERRLRIAREFSQNWEIYHASLTQMLRTASVQAEHIRLDNQIVMYVHRRITFSYAMALNDRHQRITEFLAQGHTAEEIKTDPALKANWAVCEKIREDLREMGTTM